MRVEGETYPPGTLPPLSLFRAVSGGYFEAMGMRILRGRSIDRGDVDRREPVAVISQTLARTVFKDQDPIGKRVASNQPPIKPGAPITLVWLTIVGVVTDIPMRALNETPMPTLYMPLSQGSARAGGILPGLSYVHYVVRTATPPDTLVPPVRAAVQQVDQDLAIAQVSTLQALVDRASAQMTFTMVLLAIAAGISLFLGVIGIYGVTAYIVGQRTSEIGVRLALGAVPSGITRQIVTQGGLVALAGIVIGLAAAFAASRLIASVLYGISPRDPAVFVSMAVLLLTVALIACWIPARRAARLDPTAALRAE
jgi:putative ABC transport system permease protein